MKRPILVLLIAVLAWAVLATAAESAIAADPSRLASDAIHASALWAPRISITRSAISEIHNRMSRFECPPGIYIVGPHLEDARAPDSIEEAWLLEKLYGPAQRWTLDIVPVEELTSQNTDAGELFRRQTVCGIEVGVLTTKAPYQLHVELVDDAIRVGESAA